MGKYIKSDYFNAIDSIRNTSANSKNERLNSFVYEIKSFSETSKSILKGRALKTIISRIETYSEVFEFILSEKEKIFNQMVEGNNNVIRAFTGDYDILSEELLNEIKNEISTQEILKNNAYETFKNNFKKTIFNKKKYEETESSFNNNNTGYDIAIAEQKRLYGKMSNALIAVIKADNKQASVLSNGDVSINKITSTLESCGKLF